MAPSIRLLANNGQLFSGTCSVLFMVNLWCRTLSRRARSQQATVSFDQSFECLTCAMKPNLCGVGRDCEHLRRFGSVKVLDIAQDQDRTVHFGQPIDASSYQLLGLTHVRQGLARFTPRRKVAGPLTFFVESRQQII